MRKWTCLLVLLAVLGLTTTVIPAAHALGTVYLGDRVWLDSDRDGVQDAGEPGINGVTVSIKVSGLAIDIPELTTLETGDGSDGYYLQQVPENCTCTVTVSKVQEGWTGSADSPVPVPANLELTSVKPVGLGNPAKVDILEVSNYDVDFGFAPPETKADKVNISGYVFNDSDADGVIDSGEPPLPDSGVTLKDANGNTVGTTEAAQDGAFSFTGLDAGIYRVLETNLPDYRSTNAIGGTGGSFVNSDEIVVAATTPGASYPDQDFLDTGTSPGIELVKTGPECAHRGDTVTYHFRVTNTGNTWLYGGVTVYDQMLGGNIWHKTPVAPGEVNEFDKTYTIPLSTGTGTWGWGWGCGSSALGQCTTTCPPPTSEELVNTATAVGCPPGMCSVSDTASWTIKLNCDDGRGYTTYTQGGWGSRPSGGNPGSLLHSNWSRVCRSGLIVGSCKYLRFDSAWEVTNFLPQGGCAGRLCRIYDPPTGRTSAGVFAGQVVALRLNVVFSNAGVTKTGLADLRIQRGPCAGKSVLQVLADCERVLGGKCSMYNYSVETLNEAATAINECFDNGGAGTGFLR